MVGGLLNLMTLSKEDVILIGKPNISLFKKSFQAYSNFGRQKFRIDFEGSTRLNYKSPTIYNFKIPRYGDLLQEVFFSFTLPNIWSPLLSFGGTPALFCSACRTNISNNIQNYQGLSPIPTEAWKVFVNDASYGRCSACDCSCSTQYTFWNATEVSPMKGSNETPTDGGMKWINRIYPLEFKWIENIGVQAIKSVRVYSNDSLIQEFTGQYLLNMVYRDFTENQKKIFNRMIGNTADLVDPSFYSNRNGNYPNAAYFGSINRMAYGLEPSIRSKQLFVPLNLWSTLNNKTPIPLISMQYSELKVQVELRPVNEWWVIKNVVNEMTIQAANNNIKYNSSTPSIIYAPSPPFAANTVLTGPAVESINFVEVPNNIQAFNQVVAGPPGSINDKEVPLNIPDTGLAIPDPSDNIPEYSWYNKTQVEQPDIVIAKELQIASVVPLIYTAPNCIRDIYNLKYFLKEPPPKIITNEIEDSSGSKLREMGSLPYPLDVNEVINRYYEDVPQPWFADVHLIGNYTFLTNDERNNFANNCQSYLIREVHEQTITDLLGGDHYTTIKTQGLVISWMWYFQRSDVKYRNEWSNYSNREYSKGGDIVSSVTGLNDPYAKPIIYDDAWRPSNGILNNIVWQTEYSIKNSKDILLNWGLYFNSTVRETVLDADIIAWVDRYSRSKGSGIDGVYYYNFCLNTDPFIYQPSGAVNLSKINNVNWSYKLTEPQLKTNINRNTEGGPWNIFEDIEDPFLASTAIGPYLSNRITQSVTCDTESKNTITTKTQNRENYIWYYNLHIMEERYNILKVENGIASLVLVRTI
tara:strand:- start:542 stop:2965 length:2424 start_codon:yes stop_codon:yes gene_type:complete